MFTPAPHPPPCRYILEIVEPLFETGGAWERVRTLGWMFEKKFNFSTTGELMKEHDEKVSLFRREPPAFMSRESPMGEFQEFRTGSRKLSHKLKIFSVVLKVGDFACNELYYNAEQRTAYLRSPSFLQLLSFDFLLFSLPSFFQLPSFSSLPLFIQLPPSPPSFLPSFRFRELLWKELANASTVAERILSPRLEIALGNRTLALALQLSRFRGFEHEGFEHAGEHEIAAENILKEVPSSLSSSPLVLDLTSTFCLTSSVLRNSATHSASEYLREPMRKPLQKEVRQWKCTLIHCGRKRGEETGAPFAWKTPQS